MRYFLSALKEDPMNGSVSAVDVGLRGGYSNLPAAMFHAIVFSRRYDSVMLEVHDKDGEVIGAQEIRNGLLVSCQCYVGAVAV